jgi:SET domain-containing protein
VFVIILSFTCFQVVNCYLHESLNTEDPELEIRAIRDIKQGEELTVEYGSSFWGDQQPAEGLPEPKPQVEDMMD